jgi:hypothetical protein
MSKDLRKQLEGVIQDSPPVEPTPEPEPTDEPAAEEPEDKGRSLDNVRGELLRKQEKDQDRMWGEITSLRNEIRELTQSFRAPAPQQTEPKNELDAMSVQQLEGYRGQVPPEQQAAFESYVMYRKSQDDINSRFSMFEHQQRLQQQRDQFNRTAISRFPDLTDLNSEFAREVNNRLQSQDEAIVGNNPRIVLDIANDVAIERGVKPSSRRVVRGRPAAADTAPAPSPKPQAINSPEDRAAIARKLKGALPRGKEFNMENIEKREQFYTEGEELNLRIKKG